LVKYFVSSPGSFSEECAIRSFSPSRPHPGPNSGEEEIWIIQEQPAALWPETPQTVLLAEGNFRTAVANSSGSPTTTGRGNPARGKAARPAWRRKKSDESRRSILESGVH